LSITRAPKNLRAFADIQENRASAGCGLDRQRFVDGGSRKANLIGPARSLLSPTVVIGGSNCASWSTMSTVGSQPRHVIAIVLSGVEQRAGGKFVAGRRAENIFRCREGL
jgi:hypothetical protein